MNELTIEVDAAEVGLDSERLKRIDAHFGRPLFAEAPFRGVGFGLGFAVLIDPVPGKVVGSAGEISRGGAASTAFWVDQEADLTVSFFTQLLPSSTYPIRAQLRQLVYQALTD